MSEALALGIPVSAKAILVVDDRVLLARNHRDEWELPGGAARRGRPDVGESLEDAVVRELAEEVEWHPVSSIDDLVMPDGYKRTIRDAMGGHR